MDASVTALAASAAVSDQAGGESRLPNPGDPRESPYSPAPRLGSARPRGERRGTARAGLQGRKAAANGGAYGGGDTGLRLRPSVPRAASEPLPTPARGLSRRVVIAAPAGKPQLQREPPPLPRRYRPLCTRGPGGRLPNVPDLSVKPPGCCVQSPSGCRSNLRVQAHSSSRTWK